MSAAPTIPPMDSWRGRIAPCRDWPPEIAAIRGLPIAVHEVLQGSARGLTAQELIQRHPGLETEDIAACFAFAIQCMARVPTDWGMLGLPEHPTLPPQPQALEAATLPPGDAAAPRQRPAAPSIPGYEILDELGHGGMGVVYKARHISLNRLVALKMILGGGLAGSSMLERFRLEAEAVAKLKHPGIVQIYEIGESEGSPFLAFEFVEGGNLAQLLERGPLDAAAAAKMMQELARAVQCAHEQGVVHRDLKPANILISYSVPDEGSAVEYHAKVTDFGLAKILSDDKGKTHTGEILGTPSYMAPEQAAGQSKKIGPATDIYGLGAILYELLTGRPPFQAENPLDILLQVLEKDPAPVRERNAKAPRDLETICHKCLRKEPAQRFRSAQELAEDLGRFAAGEPITARPPRMVERAAFWVRRHQLLSVAYVLCLFGVIFYFSTVNMFFQSIFGLKRIGPEAFLGCVAPTIVAMFIPICGMRSKLLGVAVGGSLTVIAGWCFTFWVPGIGRTGEEALTQAMALTLGAATAAGAILTHWKRALSWQIPLIVAFGCVGWYLSSSARPLYTGITYGFTFALLARVTAWILNREAAATSLGTLVGMVGGLYLGDQYAGRYGSELLGMGITLSGVVMAPLIILLFTLVSAYFGAVVFGLLLGQRAR